MAPEEKEQAKLIRECIEALSKANSVLISKRKELDRHIAQEQPTLFNEQRGLFCEEDMPLDLSQRAEILKPFEYNVKKLEDELQRLQKPLPESTGKLF